MTAARAPEVMENAARARSATAGSYAQYRAQASTLQEHMSATVQSAADLSYQAGPVATTHFITPLETLVAGVQTSLLPWLDQVIDWQAEKADTRLLFSAFAAEHPQLEHFGGVTRGGTLVLVHDAANVVVADLMLPYHCPEPAVDGDEPALTAPRVEPPVITRPPVHTVPTRRWAFEQEWTGKKPELTVLTDARRDVDDYVRTQTANFHEQMTLQTQFLQRTAATFTAPQVAVTREFAAGQYQDQTLGTMAEVTRMQTQAVALLEQAVAAGGGDPGIQKQLDGARETLAGLVRQATAYLASGSTSVAAGTEGARAVEQIASGVDALKGSAVFELARTALVDVAETTANRPLGAAVIEMFR
jgi:hypothetical protein